MHWQATWAQRGSAVAASSCENVARHALAAARRGAHVHTFASDQAPRGSAGRAGQGPSPTKVESSHGAGHVSDCCRNGHNEYDACALRSKDFARARSARHTAPLRAADNTSANSCARRVSSAQPPRLRPNACAQRTQAFPRWLTRTHELADRCAALGRSALDRTGAHRGAHTTQGSHARARSRNLSEQHSCPEPLRSKASVQRDD